MTGGVLEENLNSLQLKEGIDYFHFNWLLRGTEKTGGPLQSCQAAERKAEDWGIGRRVITGNVNWTLEWRLPRQRKEMLIIYCKCEKMFFIHGKECGNVLQVWLGRVDGTTHPSTEFSASHLIHSTGRKLKPPSHIWPLNMKQTGYASLSTLTGNKRKHLSWFFPKVTKWSLKHFITRLFRQSKFIWIANFMPKGNSKCLT